MSSTKPATTSPLPGELEPSEASYVRRSLIGPVVVGLLLISLFFVLWYAGKVLLLAFAGLLLGILLQTASQWVHRITHIPYKASLLLVVLLLVGLLALGTWQIQSTLVQQTDELIQTLPSTLEETKRWLSQYTWGQWVLENFSQVQSTMVSSPVFSRLSGVASAAVDALVSIVVVLFVGLYIAAEPRLYRRGLVHLVPKPRRERAIEVIDNVVYTLRWWLLGKICSMIIVGLLVFVGLWLLDVRFALVLAILAASLELIPNVGPTLAAIPAILLAFAQSTTLGISVMVLYGGVQLVESYIVLPLIERQAVSLAPAITILAVVLFATLAGLLGALLAAPITATILVLIKMLYVRDTLQDCDVKVEGAPHQ